MNKFLILTKLNLGEYFAMPKDKKLRKKRILTIAGLTICFLPIIALICVGVYSFAGAIATANGLAGLIGSIILIAQIMVIFLGTASYISVMFFSKDNEFLAQLPISSITVYLSKLLIVYLCNLIISLAVVFPAFITAGIAATASGYIVGAHYYILAIFSSIMIPILPLLIIAIMSVPMAYIAKLFKKSALASTIITLILFIGFYVGYMVLIFNVTGNLEGQEIEQFLPSIANALNIISKVLYPNYLIATAMTSNGITAFLNCLYYLLIMIAIGGLVILLTKLTYKKCSTKFTEISYSNKRVTKVSKKSGNIKALMVKDIKCILRDPGLAMNSFLGIIMAPIMAVIFGFFGGMSEASGASASQTQLSQASMMFMMAMAMLIGANYIANIALSREGEKFYIIKYLPVSITNYVKSKVYLADAYIWIGSILVGIVLLATKVNVVGALLTVANIVALGYTVNAISIKKDMKKPNLNWINTRKLMQSRSNILVMMLISFVEGIAVIVISMLVGNLISNVYIVFTIVYGVAFIINLVLAIIFRKDLWSNATVLFNNIEANNG